MFNNIKEMGMFVEVLLTGVDLPPLGRSSFFHLANLDLIILTTGSKFNSLNLALTTFVSTS